MKIKCIVILVVFISSLQSCEWTKKRLGLLTKHEIAKIGELLEQKERQKNLLNSEVDTMINCQAEFEKKKDSVEVKNIETKQEKNIEQALEGVYYIILGSFKETKNTNKLIDKVEGLGYNVKRLSLLRGLETVAIGEYSSNEEALEAMKNMKNEPFYSNDFWIYKQKNRF